MGQSPKISNEKPPENVGRTKKCAFSFFRLPTRARPIGAVGLIERVNEENGFGVLKVKAKGHRDLVTVVGSLPSANPGEWLTAEGRWIQDREFGLQFRSGLVPRDRRSRLTP